MDLVKLRQKSQLTIPKDVRKKLGISPGDYLSIETKGNEIRLIPKVVSGDDGVELSERREKELKEALNDLKEGNVTVYENVDELVDNLME